MKPDPGSSEPITAGPQSVAAPEAVPGLAFLYQEVALVHIYLQQLNEALLQTRLEAEGLRARYSEMYDLAPIGYFTLDSETRIRETNLMGAALLGSDARTLLNLPLIDFMDTASRRECPAYWKRLLETGVKQTCELRFVAKMGHSFYGQLEGIAVGGAEASGERFRIALFDISDRKQAEEQIRKQQQLLTHGFMNMLEDERRAMAYDLHDGLTQYVMASQAFMDTYAERYRATQEQMPEDLEKGLKYLSQAVVEARRVVNNLRSLVLDDLGLTGALEQLLTEEKLRTGWQKADLHHNIPIQRFETVLETAVYRVAQEALANARKHAETNQVQVLLRNEPATQSGPSRLTLEVRDWGKGFEAQAKRKEYDHLGLHSMAEHVNLLHGSFEIWSVPGEGTRIRAIFPVPD